MKVTLVVMTFMITGGKSHRLRKFIAPIVNCTETLDTFIVTVV
jgi:hypothetical protein